MIAVRGMFILVFFLAMASVMLAITVYIALSLNHEVITQNEFEMQCIEKYGVDTVFGKERVPLAPKFKFNDSFVDVVFGIENGTDYMYWCSEKRQ